MTWEPTVKVSKRAMMKASPRVAGGDEAVGADRGRVVVVGEEDGEAGDVAVGAVGVAGADGHLLGGALAVEDGVPGVELDADDGGRAC